ncbi:hypothetical protein NFI96_019759, partial [Prochilodus magdalenae]
MKEDDLDIAVVGLGCNFPGGEGLDNFWKVLLEGKNCVGEIPVERFDSAEWYDQDDTKPGKSRTKKAALADGFDEFDHKFFGVTEAEVEQMDPQHKVLLQCTYRALENAGLPMEKASGSRTGVFIGLMNRDYELTMSNMNPVIINHCTGTGQAMSIAANRISYTFNFTGPSLAIDCACSSSLVALHLACQAIREVCIIYCFKAAGDCEMAVCGGVSSIFQPRIFVALSKAKMISPEGTSKPFSQKADGYGRGEGCGVILLKPLKKALEDHDSIWGIICKTAVNQDGHTVTPMTKPSMVQQEELLNRIYSAESYLSDVQYVEAHGTGTPVGDPIEAEESESYFQCRIMPVVVLSLDSNGEVSDIPLTPKPQKLFQDNSVYIVTGGLSGLGFETVKFIAERGGGNIVILSRSSPSHQMEQEINNVKNQCQSVITCLRCDVSVSEQVYHTVAQIRKLFPSNPIKGIFHSAVVLHDGLIENLNKSLYEKVMRPKVNGVINLHHATKHCNLDYFVCYSSISAFLGNASQTNYASANTFMDTFCQYRRNIGLPAQSINWGALNLGLLLNKDHFQRFLEAKGMMVLEVGEILESLEKCLLINKAQQAVCRFNFKNVRNNVLSQNKTLKIRLAELVEEDLKKSNMINSRFEQASTASSPQEYIRSVISDTTGVEKDDLTDDTPLSSLGLDSMLAMTLQNLIFQEKGVNIPL